MCGLWRFFLPGVLYCTPVYLLFLTAFLWWFCTTFVLLLVHSRRIAFTLLLPYFSPMIAGKGDTLPPGFIPPLNFAKISVALPTRCPLCRSWGFSHPLPGTRCAAAGLISCGEFLLQNPPTVPFVPLGSVLFSPPPAPLASATVPPWFVGLCRQSFGLCQ